MKITTLPLLLLFWLAITLSFPALSQEAVSPKRAKAAPKKAKKIRKKLVRGADFALLARKHSEDPGSAIQGGELGFVTPGQFVPEFEKAVTQLTPGGLSPPVRTKFGYHIIELLEREGEKFKTRHILIKP